MIVKQRVKGFICTTAHPTGCATNVNAQINHIQNQTNNSSGPKNVLVIGASTGYGLASRITAAFGYNAKTIGVFLEKAATGKRTATAGWYNTAAFQQAAEAQGLYSKNINGDAFSHELKQQAVDLIKQDLGQVDLVIYSLASPRRTDPDTGDVYMSTLKPIGNAVTQTGVDTDKEIVKPFTLEPATEDDIQQTVKVMGGEDWELWIKALTEADVLTTDCKTVAYTYVGEAITRDIYWDGTIGAAKKDLDRAAAAIRNQYQLAANVAVLKAVVTQSSAAIPIMPLYLAILFKVMKQNGSHEGCIEQIQRLFAECLFHENPAVDAEQRYRVDEKEISPAVQDEVARLWPQVTTENLGQLTDFEGFRSEFLRLFGFGLDAVDYDAEVTTDVDIGQMEAQQ